MLLVFSYPWLHELSKISLYASKIVFILPRLPFRFSGGSRWTDSKSLSESLYFLPIQETIWGNSKRFDYIILRHSNEETVIQNREKKHLYIDFCRVYKCTRAACRLVLGRTQHGSKQGFLHEALPNQFFFFTAGGNSKDLHSAFSVATHATPVHLQGR